jgi:hypothetical protein
MIGIEEYPGAVEPEMAEVGNAALVLHREHRVVHWPRGWAYWVGNAELDRMMMI